MMGQRTTVKAVKDVLGGAYGPVGGQLRSLQPHIDSASNLVTQAVALAAKKIVNRMVLDVTTQELMERWTAAFFYTLMDRPLDSKSTAGASGSFSKDELAGNPFLAGAIRQDPSGTLNALLTRKFAGGAHIGSCGD